MRFSRKPKVKVLENGDFRIGDIIPSDTDNTDNTDNLLTVVYVFSHRWEFVRHFPLEASLQSNLFQNEKKCYPKFLVRGKRLASNPQTVPSTSFKSM